MIDLIITLGSLGLFVWFVIVEPLRNRLRSLRPPPLPPPRYAPLRETREGDESEVGKEGLLHLLKERYHEPVPVGTGSERYGVVRGGTDDTTEENQDDPRYARVLELVRGGYSGNQIVPLVGGSRAGVLALVKRAREEMG